MEHHHPTEAAIWDYVSKSADSHTVKEVKQWINSAVYDQALFEKITAIYNVTGENPYATDIQIEASKKLFFDTLAAGKSTRYPWKNILKYAAMFVFFAAVVTYSYQQFTSKEVLILVQTTYGEQKEITLSDGSTVWLNASSTLSYNEKSPRTLNLDGEAFFEVAKDTHNPFTVTTPDNIKVKALGTSFNVKSYSAHSYTETILYTGKVAITSTTQFTMLF